MFLNYEYFFYENSFLYIRYLGIKSDIKLRALCICKYVEFNSFVLSDFHRKDTFHFLPRKSTYFDWLNNYIVIFIQLLNRSWTFSLFIMNRLKYDIKVRKLYLKKMHQEMHKQDAQIVYNRERVIKLSFDRYFFQHYINNFFGSCWYL